MLTIEYARCGKYSNVDCILEQVRVILKKKIYRFCWKAITSKVPLKFLYTFLFNILSIRCKVNTLSITLASSISFTIDIIFNNAASASYEEKVK